MISFDQFRNLVIDDLNRTSQPYELDMESGFRDFRQEIGRGGYQFSLPTCSRQYSYCPEDGWYYSWPASQGRGATLQEAIAQAQEPVNA
jgi:hypothetical protein